MQTLVLNVPDDVYQDWKEQAESSNRSVEEMVLELLEVSRAKDGGLNPELRKKLEAMEVLDSRILKQILAKFYSLRKSNRIENLSFKRGRGEKLTEKEQAEVDQIVAEQREFMLVRANAMSLLAKRGVDVKPLLDKAYERFLRSENRSYGKITVE